MITSTLKLAIRTVTDILYIVFDPIVFFGGICLLAIFIGLPIMAWQGWCSWFFGFSGWMILGASLIVIIMVATFSILYDWSHNGGSSESNAHS